MSDDPNLDPLNGSADGMHPMAKLLFGWVGRPGVGNIIFWALGALSAVLILIDLGVSRHAETALESSFGFYGFYGFLAFGFVVLMGWPLGRLLRRGEDYYGDADAPNEGGERE